MALTNTPDVIVNGTTITAAMIDAEIQYHPADNRRQAMIKAAETLIIGELLVQKANEKGITTESGISLIEQQPKVVDSLINAEVAVPEATEEECLRYFEANRETFKTAPLLEVSHILIAADPKDLESRAEALQLAKELIGQIVNKAHSFQELAKQYSACPSKEVGGSLGQISHGQTVSEFERQVFAANEGLMQQPVESRYGYHVVFIARKVEGKELPFDMVQEKIKHYLDDKVQRKALSQYLHKIVSEADIQGFEFNIDESTLMQ